MSLVRLLSAGKSLVGERDLTGKYRLPQSRAVPEFGNPRNPFVPPTATETVTLARTVPSNIPVAPEPDPAVPAGSAPAAVPPPRPVDATSGANPVGAEAKPGFWGRLWHRLAHPGGWFKGRPRSPIPVFQKVPVQGELSLERVKVMRNDLHDTDVELVPMRPGRARPAAGTSSEPALEPKAPCRCSNTSPS